MLDAVRALWGQRRGRVGRGLGEEFRSREGHAGGGSHKLQKGSPCQHKGQYEVGFGRRASTASYPVTSRPDLFKCPQETV